MYSGYKVGRQQVEATLLQFANDMLLFADESIKNIMSVKAIMRCFELVSSLKVNFHKNSLEGVGMNTYVLHRYASIHNCYPMVIPFVYLSIPIGENPRRETVWVPFLEKYRKKV